jgi:HEAT repeat protein
MIRSLVTLVRNFMGLILLAAIAAGGAWAQNGNPGPESPPDVSQLIQQLKSLDTHERVHAAREFEKIKPLPPEAIKALVEMLRTAPYDEAQYAITALSGAGPQAIPPLAALANAGNEPAVWTLGRMAFSEPGAWPVLVGLFKSESSDIRSAAASGLAIAGPPVVPLLVKALADDDLRMRAGAAETLVHMRLRPTNEIGVRYAKPKDLAPAAPQLAKLLSDPDLEVRDRAALALAYADPGDKRAAPILGQILDRVTSSENPYFFKLDVIAALQNIGGNAKSAVPALERVLAGNADWLSCVAAARALGKIGGTEACAPLAQAIAGRKNDEARGWNTDAADSINRVRAGAADAIVEISPVCPQTIPILIATLGKPWSATSDLMKLGSPAIPALAAASRSPNLSVREDAVQTLAAIEPVGPEAGHALMVALKDQRLDLHSRQAAVDALAGIKPLTPDAVDGLMLALKDKSDTIRSTAAKALQDQGGEAGGAARAALKREQSIEARRSKPDTSSYSKEELIATIQNPDLEYPLTLTYLVPILPTPAPIDDAPFVVTVHTAEDQNERLTVWKKTGVDRYQNIKVMVADRDNQEHFHVPTTFQAIVQVTTAGGHQSEEREFFVEIPVEWYRGGEARIFAVDSDGLHSVDIESPEEMVPDPKQIPLKYQTVSRGPDLGSYHELDWSFPVSNEEDPMCCPSGGEVSGTYKIVKDGTESPATWKMVVATAKFIGPSEAAEGAKKLAGTSQLIRELKGSNLQQRKDALRKLSNTAPLPPEAIQPLAEVAKTLDPTEPLPSMTQTPGQGAKNAVVANISMAPGISRGGQQSCEIAIAALGRGAKRDPTVWSILIEALKECSSPKLAADQLAMIGPPVVPLLVKALKDKDPRVRAGAAEALGQMLKPPLMRAYSPDEPFGIRVGAAAASAAALAPAAPGLAEALQDPDSTVRNQAAITLALIAPNDKRPVPILVQLLQGADEPLREAALAALDGMGESAKDAVPTVERVLATDKDPHAAAQAAHVLASTAGAAACEPLARAIADSKEDFVPQSAATAMGRLWPACPQTIPTLTGTFGGVESVAFTSARALGKIGKPAMPALTAALKSADPNTRQAAAEAFASMNVALTPEAVDALTVALGDKDSVVRTRAAQSLHNAGGAAQQAALAEEKREEEADEAAHPEPPPVPKFSEQQIIAPIHPDANHKYPLKLALFAPISGYAVTLHTRKDRPERLVFWKVADDKYQKVVLMESDPHSGEHFQVPTSFGTIIGYPPPDSFVDVATLGRGGVTDRVLRIDYDEDQLQTVEIESPEDWYKNKLAPSETVRHPGRDFFSDDGLEFEFQIWNSNDQDCCPTAGEVTGTYKIVRAQPSIALPTATGFFLHGVPIVVAGSGPAQAQTSQSGTAAVPHAGTVIAGAENLLVPIQPPHVWAPLASHGGGGGVGFVYNEQNSAPTWKMVVDTAKRQP